LQNEFNKIQSLPKLKLLGNILFVDVFEKYADYSKAKSLLKIMAEYFKVLGEYKNKTMITTKEARYCRGNITFHLN
jgi:prephenate dehydratase